MVGDTALDIDNDEAAMANFAVNPLVFISDGMTVNQGPVDRVLRTRMVVPAVPPLQHDRVIIAETNRFVPIQLREQMRDDVRAFLVESGCAVLDWDDHPFWIGGF